jgi:hypothetical protein
MALKKSESRPTVAESPDLAGYSSDCTDVRIVMVGTCTVVDPDARPILERTLQYFIWGLILVLMDQIH